jgi:hypothetical protein
MKSDSYQLYLRDLVFLIKERYSEMSNEKSKVAEFEAGVKHGYFEILELIQSQAAAFQIKLEEFGFMDFDTYKENENKN